MVFVTQLKVLLWKNFTKRWRNPVLFIAELLWPLVIFAVVAGVRTTFSVDKFKECSFPPRALPSTGTVSFLTSYICDFNNPCGSDATLNDVPGKITNFNDSLVSTYIRQINGWIDGMSSFTLLDGIIEGFDILFLSPRDETSDGIGNNTQTLIEAEEESLMQFRNSTEVLETFVKEAKKRLDSINNTLPQFLLNLLNESAASTVDQISEAVCGKRASILKEHRHEDGMSGTIAWLFSIVMSEGRVAKENITDPEFEPGCAALFENIEKDIRSRVLWRILKPLLLGHINYTPDNPVIKRIIAEASRTFDTIDQMFNLVSDLKVVLQNLMKLHTDAKATQAVVIRRCNIAFANTTICDTIEGLLGSIDRSYDFLSSLHEVVKKIETYTNCTRVDRFQGQPTVEDLLKESEKQRKTDRFWGAIVFDNIEYDTEEIPKTVKYTIRMDPHRTEQTHIYRDWAWTFSDKASPMTTQEMLFGFAFIQDMIDHAIIRLHTHKSHEPGVYMQPFPFPSYVEDNFVRNILFGLPLLMVISWTFSLALIVNGIVSEKETRLKETLKIMGLGNGVNWLAWFINCLLPMMLTAILLCILLKFGGIFPHSDPSLVSFFLCSFITSTISFAFFVSVIFDKSSLASVWSALMFLATYLPDMAINLHMNGLEMALGEKLAMCISPTMAMAQGIRLIGNFEIQTVGAQWGNIHKSPSERGQFSLLICIAMIFLDSLVLTLAATYIDHVFPGKYGIASSWNFFTQKSFWSGAKAVSRNISLYDRTMSMTHYYGRRGSYERHKVKTKAGVAVRDLTKLYKGADRPAVDKLSLNFYEDQITSFLGHNGAGKTTTLSILTGLLAPTTGTAFIDDLDIRTDIDKIRHSIGWCPQYNILIDYLTVEEHIWLFGQLRKRDGENIVLDVDQLVKDIGLWDKRTCKSVDLSGGMKRKLCVALAFVGGSSTVILDEPTAGVDPYSRRAIWELLLKFKAGRTIILSTHHMDEADVLGDRIAIISNGKLRAVGSSLFLKDRFGSGYYLTLQRVETSMNRGSSTSVSCSDFEESNKTSEESKNKVTFANVPPVATLCPDPAAKANIVDFVQRYVNSAVLIEDNDLQTCFRISDDSDHGNELVQLLDALEESKDDLGIASYGISDTDLEEVFLKIARPNNIEVSDSHADLVSSSFTIDTVSQYSGTSESNLSINIGSLGFTKLQKVRRYHQQISALFGKRFHNFKRNIRAFATQIFAPAFFVCLSTIVSLIIPMSIEMPPIELQPWHLELDNQPLVMFYSNGNRDNMLSNKIESNLLNYPHYGTRCLDRDTHTISGKSCLSLKKYKAEAMIGDLKKHLEGDCERDKSKCNANLTTLPKGMLRTNDYLYDLSGHSCSGWLLKTESQYRLTRYGGYSFNVINDLGRVKKSDILSATKLVMTALDVLNVLPDDHDRVQKHVESVSEFAYNSDNIKVWVNNHGVHAGTAYVNGVNNLLLRALLPEYTSSDEYGIVTSSYPLRRSKEYAIKDVQAYSGGFLASAICILFAFSFVPAGFVVFVVEEKSSDSKDLQILCGIKPSLYWIVNWIWDMVNYILVVGVCILILFAFGEEQFVSAKNLPYFVTLLMFYGWSVTPLMYILSRFFKEPSASFVILAGLNVSLGVLTTLGSYIPSLVSLKLSGGVMKVDETLNQVLSFVPHYCLTRGIFDMCLLHAEVELKSSFGESVEKNLLDWDQNGLSFLAMACMGLTLNVMVLILENPCCSNVINKLRSTKGKKAQSNRDFEDEDVDVAREKERIMSGDDANDMLRLEQLTKVHFGSRQPAVDHLCVGVPQAQCFGLLGVNGAGKSTTFKMLTGNLPVTSGDASVAGYSVHSNISQVRQLIGYCPQSDALNPLLTGMEHLEFYAKARGTEPANVKLVALWAIKTFGLQAYADKVVQSYSGGNKRKLSVAIALIGGPPVLFLDEPTAGMDPVARRFLWNCINRVVKSGKTVILTSHSMEECEALCNRLAIMVNGKFQCLGSVQHLKHRFGGGYTIILRVGGINPDLTSIQEYISSSLPSAKLVEQRHNMLQYQLGKDSISLSKMFKTMECAKVLCGVEDYSVSQTTLEQVFMSFAKNQRKSYKEEDTEVSIAEKENGIPLQDLSQRVFTVSIPEKSSANNYFFRSLSSAQNDDDGIPSLNVFEGVNDSDTTNGIVSVRL